jgi:transposase
MNGKLLAVSGTDSTLHHQYLSTLRRSEHFEPEKALLRAILEDAIHCYRKYQMAQSRSGRERFREAEAWIMRSRNNWIFSFANVCQLLGLDPMYVRQRLRGQKKNSTVQTKARQRAPRRAA